MTSKFRRATSPKVEVVHAKIVGDRFTHLPSTNRERVWYAGGISPKDEYLSRVRDARSVFK